LLPPSLLLKVWFLFFIFWSGAQAEASTRAPETRKRVEPSKSIKNRAPRRMALENSPVLTVEEVFTLEHVRGTVP